MAKRMEKGAPMFDFDRIEKQIENARVRAEKIAKRTWNETLDLLPAGQRKAVRNTTARIEKTTKDLQRRSEKAIDEIGKRGRKIVAEVEKRAASAAKPIMERLDMVTRDDVERLTKRIAQVERKLKESRRAAA